GFFRTKKDVALAGDISPSKPGSAALLRWHHGELETRRRELQVRALRLALQIDHDALVVSERRYAGSLAGGSFGAGGRAHAVQVIDALEVVDVARRLRLRDSHLGHRETFDLHLVGLALEVEVSVAPAPADSSGHRTFRQSYRGVRRLVLRDRSRAQQ